MSSTTPPNAGTDAPHTPLRPPATVSGTADVAGRTTATTSSVDRGRTTTSAELRDLAGERPVQRQRPPVAARPRRPPSPVRPRRSRRAREQLLGTSTAGCVKCGAGPGRAQSAVWVRWSRPPPRRRTAPVVVDLAVGLGALHPSSAAISSATSGAARSSPAVEEVGARAPRRTSSSVVAISCAPRTPPRRAGTAARRPAVRERGSSAISALTSAAAVPYRPARWASASRAGVVRRRRRRVGAGGSGGAPRRGSAEAATDVVDGVLGHLAVRGELAAADADRRRGADRRRRAGVTGRRSCRSDRRSALDERPQPGPHAGDVVARDRRSSAPG